MVLSTYLKRYAHPAAHGYLSECDMRMTFSALHKVYYFALRPVIPLPIRHYMQNRYLRRVTCHSDFIWDEFPMLLKSDEFAWNQYVTGLYPNGYRTSIVLTHDVETQQGFDFIPKVIEVEERHGFRSSWNFVARKYDLRDEVVDLILAHGNEIGIHGYNHDGTLYYSEQRFLKRAAYINQALKRFGAVGFRSPQVHRDLRLLQQLDILYDASCFDYDPYQPFPGGTGSIWPFVAGKFIELPYTIPQDHTLFYVLGEKDISIWKRKTAWLVQNCGMILTLTHPDYLLEKDHLKHYDEYLGYLSGINNSWHCLPREMAEWYRSLPDE
jgi:peptidoglycan/xylan/chitin deacetylase (PgdA/CDA1 family)